MIEILLVIILVIDAIHLIFFLAKEKSNESKKIPFDNKLENISA